MMYTSNETETNGLMQAAALMSVAARTAPKAIGKDTIHTLLLTGEEKELLARKMEELGDRDFPDRGASWYKRDAANLRAAQAVLLIGAERACRGVKNCGYCGFENCAGCQAAGGVCAFVTLDLGIALSSALCAAADMRVDNRVMMSVGKAAEEMHYTEKNIMWQGIPVSVSGKNIFFDRHRQRG